jgi:cell division protein FtsW (lipid II flippase)
VGQEIEWFRRKNTPVDYLVCIPGMTASSFLAIHGIATETFITQTRHHPAQYHYGTTAVWLALVEALIACIFVGWLLRGSRWRNLALAVLCLSYLIVVIVVLIAKS